MPSLVVISVVFLCFFFFFTDTATPEIYTLSLHDALPIYETERLMQDKSLTGRSSWTRLFDETMARMRFDFEGKSISLEQVLDKLSDPDRRVRQKAVEALAVRFKEDQPLFRSEERRVGKECRSRWSQEQKKRENQNVKRRVSVA